MTRTWLECLLLLSLLGGSPAFARDHGQFADSDEKKREWFQGLNSGKGPCCADADGNTLKDSDWESVRDASKPHVHYKVFIEQQWVDVPDEAVLTQPNLYGRTIVWPVYSRDISNNVSKIDIRCFIVGTLM